MAKPRKKGSAPEPVRPRIPVIGERVRRPGSDTEFEITFVSVDYRQVNIGIPRTNFERRYVDVSTLIFLDEPRTPPKPSRPAYNVKAIEERLAVAQHASARKLSGKIAILTPSVAKGFPAVPLYSLPRWR